MITIISTLSAKAPTIHQLRSETNHFRTLQTTHTQENTSDELSWTKHRVKNTKIRAITQLPLKVSFSK